MLDVKTSEPVTRYEGHDRFVVASAYSPDGKVVATAGGQRYQIHVWDPFTGENESAASAALQGSGRGVWGVGISADGSTLGWGHSQPSTYPYPGSGPLERELRLPSVGMTPEAITLAKPEAATSDRSWLRGQSEVGQWSLRGSGIIEQGLIPDITSLDILKADDLQASIKRGPQNGFNHTAFSFSPDGQTVYSGGGLGALKAYKLDGTELPMGFEGHSGQIWGLAISSDGKYLVSGSDDKTVRLWNAKTGELIVTLFDGADDEWVMWTPEGFYAASEGASKLVGWQIDRGPNEAPRYITAGQLAKALFRPDLVTAKILGDPYGLVQQAVAKLSIDELLKKRAPQVAILSPEDGARLNEASVNVTVRVTDQGDGVGKFYFKLDGQRIYPIYGPKSLSKDGTYTADSLNLVRPDTKIEIVAEDKSGDAQSAPAAITVHTDPKTIQGVADLYVLAIGANGYHNLSSELHELYFADSDAGDVAETFKKAGSGFYPDPPIVKRLVENQVTADDIETAFKRPRR